MFNLLYMCNNVIQIKSLNNNTSKLIFMIIIVITFINIKHCSIIINIKHCNIIINHLRKDHLPMLHHLSAS